MRAWIHALLLAFLLAAGASRAQQPGNYEGLWWADPPGSDPGWGLNVVHQGGVLFATLFIPGNDAIGPYWFVMPDMRRTGAAIDAQGNFLWETYQGGGYYTSGPAFDSPSFDPQRVVRTAFGNWYLHFYPDGRARIESSRYEFGRREVMLTRQLFGSPTPVCTHGGAPGATPNYTALWWASPPGSESGWGINLVQQGDVIFATWFTYARNGEGTWFVMSDARRTATGAFSGTVYRTTRPVSGAPVNTPVGSATFTFNDLSNGAFTYSVDGASGSKAITRQLFASPQTVCR